MKANVSRKMGVQAPFPPHDLGTYGCPATATPPPIHLRFQAPHEGKGQQENGCASPLPPKTQRMYYSM
jgi:hypothetical protein